MSLIFQTILITSSQQLQKISNKIPKTPKCFDSYLKNSNKNYFFLSPMTKEDIKDILSTLKTYKTAGPGSVPIRILKDFKKFLSRPLSDLINLSFSLGTFPETSQDSPYF